jgi:AraC-like DNA-binding protein
MRWPTGIADLLAADPTDGRSLGEFGRTVGAGERTLSRLFREQTGMTFPQWRAALRLQHAPVLLANGESVTVVAAASGYRSCSAFIEAFGNAFGATPGTYQRQLAGRSTSCGTVAGLH